MHRRPASILGRDPSPNALGARLAPLRDRHGRDEQQAEGDALDKGIEPKQVHAVIQDADQDDGEEGPEDRPLAPGRRCAAQEDGGDRLQLQVRCR